MGNFLGCRASWIKPSGLRWSRHLSSLRRFQEKFETSSSARISSLPWRRPGRFHNHVDIIGLALEAVDCLAVRAKRIAGSEAASRILRICFVSVDSAAQFHLCDVCSSKLRKLSRHSPETSRTSKFMFRTVSHSFARVALELAKAPSKPHGVSTGKVWTAPKCLLSHQPLRIWKFRNQALFEPRPKPFIILYSFLVRGLQ